MIKRINIKLLGISLLVYLLAIHYFVTTCGLKVLSYEDSIKVLFLNLNIFNNNGISTFNITSLSTTVLTFILIFKDIANKANDAKGYYLLCLHRQDSFNKYHKNVFIRFNIYLALNLIGIFVLYLLGYFAMSLLLTYELSLGNLLSVAVYFVKIFLIFTIYFELVSLTDLFGIPYFSYTIMTIVIVLLLVLDVLSKTSIVVFGEVLNDLVVDTILMILLFSSYNIQNKFVKRKDLI